MGSTTFDFAIDDVNTCYPEHGWTLNSQGNKLLWLPILRLVNNTNQIRKLYGCEKQITHSQWNEIRAFHALVEKLFITLRELHRATTHVENCGGIAGTKLINLNMHETITLYVDLVYVYLRRFADHFTRTIRHAVFQHYAQAPREMKNLLKKEPEELDKLKPFIDIEQFLHAVKLNTSWFRFLRSDSVTKGIRDTLEHHPNTINVQSSQVADEPWKVEAYLMNGQEYTALISPINGIMKEICNMLTEVCKVVGCESNYKFWITPYGDCLLTAGTNTDPTGFWPKIENA